MFLLKVLVQFNISNIHGGVVITLPIVWENPSVSNLRRPWTSTAAHTVEHVALPKLLPTSELVWVDGVELAE